MFIKIDNRYINYTLIEQIYYNPQYDYCMVSVGSTYIDLPHCKTIEQGMKFIEDEISKTKFNSKLEKLLGAE